MRPMGGPAQRPFSSRAEPVRWMDKPPGDDNLLAHLRSLQYFSIKESITLTDVVKSIY